MLTPFLKTKVFLIFICLVYVSNKAFSTYKSTTEYGILKNVCIDTDFF